MSRTFRRKDYRLINRWVGSREEHTRDPQWLMYRYPTLTFDQAYARLVACYTRDHHKGHYGVPRWFRRLHGSKQLRLNESIKLHRHQWDDSWDNHVPESRCRNAKWYWW